MKLEKMIAVRTTKTVYRDEDKTIKVFNCDYSKADILGEALNHARIEETEMNVPQILEVTKIDGKWAIVFEYIEGKTLAQLMEENPDKHDEYLNLFIDLQMRVHGKRASLLNNLTDKMDEKIRQANLDATTRYDLRTRLKGAPKGIDVCHGDFNPTNVVIAEDGTPYILDWSHATQGNANADVARTYLLFWLNGDIEGAHNYLELFCKKSDTAKQDVQEWMPIVAAAQSVEGNEKEREFLLSWVNVVDFE